MSIPNDPVMLLSYVNTLLRDYYPTLESLCKDRELNQGEITEKLDSIDYSYSSQHNQFI